MALPRDLLHLVLEYGVGEEGVLRILCFLWPETFGSVDARRHRLAWTDVAGLVEASARAGVARDVDWGLRMLHSMRDQRHVAAVAGQASNLAAAHGHWDSVERCLSDPSVEMQLQATAAGHAAAGGHDHVVQHLMARWPREDWDIRQAAACSHLLAGRPDLAELYMGDCDFFPALSWVAGNSGNLEFILRHIKSDHLSRTGVLMGAAAAGHCDVVKRCVSLWLDTDDADRQRTLSDLMRHIVMGWHRRWPFPGWKVAAAGPAPMLRCLLELAQGRVAIDEDTALDWFAKAVATRDVELLRCVWSLGKLAQDDADEELQWMTADESEEIEMLRVECGASPAACQAALSRLPRLKVTEVRGKRKRSVRAQPAQPVRRSLRFAEAQRQRLLGSRDE